MTGLLPNRLSPARRNEIIEELGGVPEYLTYSWSCHCRAKIVVSDARDRRDAETAAADCGWSPSSPGIMRCPTCTATGEPGLFGGSSSDGSNRYGPQMARADGFPPERWIMLGAPSEEKLLSRVASYVSVVARLATRGQFGGAVTEAQRLAIRCLEGDVEWRIGVVL